MHKLDPIERLLDGVCPQYISRSLLCRWFRRAVLPQQPKLEQTNTVPIRLKMTLTAREAAEYSNISINKIDSMLRVPNCLFVLFVGTKKLVKHRELEQYISRTTAI